QEAADVVGAEWRGGAGGHGRNPRRVQREDRSLAQTKNGDPQGSPLQRDRDRGQARRRDQASPASPSPSRPRLIGSGTLATRLKRTSSIANASFETELSTVTRDRPATPLKPTKLPGVTAQDSSRVLDE